MTETTGPEPEYPYEYFVSYSCLTRTTQGFGNMKFNVNRPVDFEMVKEFGSIITATKGVPDGSVAVLYYQLLSGPSVEPRLAVLESEVERLRVQVRRVREFADRLDADNPKPGPGGFLAEELRVILAEAVRRGHASGTGNLRNLSKGE